MIEKQLIKLMLNIKFYTKYKASISRSVFEGNFGSLYETIQKAHIKYNKDITLGELYSLHTSFYNPSLTRASKEQLSKLIEDIKETEEPSESIAKDIVHIMSDRELARRIAVEATEIYNGKDANFNLILDIIEKHKAGLPEDKIDSITSNISDLLNELNKTTQWKFNIPVLHKNVSGLGEGNLAIFFARPETGKTAFWVSLVGGRGGFAEQGAKIHAFINEEPAVRVQMRLINCYTGMTNPEIISNIEKAHNEWEKIRQNIILLDTIDWTVDDIDSHCEKHKPDIIVIDQLDKVGISGSFARTDEKLRAIYSGVREIAKRRKCCVIAISQASADAHNRSSVSFDMMENSKTGKAAEADLIIGIGRNINIDPTDRTRHLCVSKNKITGYHGEPDCIFDKNISRYRA
mgnify:FL=1